MSLIASVFKKGNGSTGPGAVTADRDTTGANLLVAVCTFYGPLSNAADCVITDNKSGNDAKWTLKESKDSVSGGGTAIFHCENPTVGSGHHWLLSGTGIYGNISVFAFSDAIASPAFDQHTSANNDAGATSTLQSGSITPTANGEIIIFGSGEYNSGNTSTVNSSIDATGHTAAPSAAVNVGHLAGYLIQGTAGAINPTVDWHGTSSGSAAIASWKTTSGSALAVSGAGSFAPVGAALRKASFGFSGAGALSATSAASSSFAMAGAGALDPRGAETAKSVFGFGPGRRNLLSYTEAFDNAYWVQIGASATPNVTTDPFGGSLADKLVEDNLGTNPHQIRAAEPIAASVKYSLSVYAKAAERNYLLLYFGDASGTIVGASYDLSTGKIFGFTAGSGLSGQCYPAGNGWHRCVVTWTPSSTPSSPRQRIAVSANGAGTGYTGDGASGIYIFGAQFEVGDATPYQQITATSLPAGPAFAPSGIAALRGALALSGSGAWAPVGALTKAATSALAGSGALSATGSALALSGFAFGAGRRNLLFHTDLVTNSNWTKLRVTASAVGDVMPLYGDNNTTRLITTASTGTHGVQQDPVPAAGQNEFHTVSVYARPLGGYNWLAIIFDTHPGQVIRYFDLLNQKPGGATVDHWVESVDGQWCRCCIRIATGTGSNPNAGRVQFLTTSANNVTSFTANGTSGMVLWGEQREIVSTNLWASPYQQITSGQVANPGGGAFAPAGSELARAALAASGAGAVDYRSAALKKVSFSFAGSAATDFDGVYLGGAHFDFSGAGALDARSAAQKAVSFAFAGAGSLAAIGAIRAPATLAFAGSAAFAGSLAAAARAALAFVGGGSLSAAGAERKTAAVAFAGAGSMAPVGALSGETPEPEPTPTPEPGFGVGGLSFPLKPRKPRAPKVVPRIAAASFSMGGAGGLDARGRLELAAPMGSVADLAGEAELGELAAQLARAEIARTLAIQRDDEELLIEL